MSYCLSLEKIMTKQQLKIKSSIVNTNNHLNRFFPFFDSLYKELSSGFKLVDNFPNHFSFNCKDKESKEAHFYKLNKIAQNALLDFHIIIIVSDVSIKNNITTSILYILSGHNTIAKTIYYAINITSTETELFTIRCRINQAV